MKECSMSRTPARAARAVSRGALAVVIVIAGVSALLALVYAALWIGGIQREFMVEVPVATPLDLTPVVHGTAGDSVVQYSTVLISSYEPLTGARIQLALATALRFAVFFGACVVVILLAARLWRRRPFAGLATYSRAGVGVFAVAVAFAAPWLEMSGTLAGVTALGFPLSGESSPVPTEEWEWVVPPEFSLQHADWLLLGFGVVLGLVAALFAHALRLQRDTEGLV
jgi:hypothetical protein